MNDTETNLNGPDLVAGIALSKLIDGAMLLGHAQANRCCSRGGGNEVFAIGAVCTHYGAPLADGLLVGRYGSLSLASCLFQPAYRRRSPRAGARPGLLLARRAAGRQRLCPRKARSRGTERSSVAAGAPKCAAIWAVGAAGNAAAETLRREGYSGRLIVLSADGARPCDRPNLSKGFLAGTASAESNPLRPRRSTRSTTST